MLIEHTDKKPDGSQSSRCHVTFQNTILRRSVFLNT